MSEHTLGDAPTEDAAEFVKQINDAWQTEGSIGRLGLRPFANKAIQRALIPSGGDWQCVTPEGAITRSIVWGQIEVALVNPRGDLGDATVGQIAMALRAAPLMDKALRSISILAKDPTNSALVERIARAAVDYIEQPAPRFVEPEDEEDEREEDGR